MREILFRGTRLDNGEWVEGHLLTYEDGRTRINPSHTEIFCYEKDDSIIQTVAYPVDPATVGQYTGLIDKDGVKIFEGDIVKFPSPFYRRNEYGSVLWSNDEAKFNIFASDWHGDFEDEDFNVRNLKVIGNIF